MSENVNNLFQTAREDGIISPSSMNALTVMDIGEEIQNALTGNIDAMELSEVVLVTLMPDDSGSIRFEGNAQIVRDGHNLVIDALAGSKQGDSILMHTRYLNGEILFPYTNIVQAIRMDSQNYDPRLGTPLYDQSVLLLGAVIAQAQQFIDNGVAVRTVTLIITDGADAHSSRANAAMVKSIVDDMLRTEDHIVAGMGIDDGYTDFKQVFQSMGIRDEWILTPKNSDSEIRRAFQVFSQSAVRASQNAPNFSQVAQAGAFGG
ncbi:hypothetical protein KAI65_01630 [Candidatus Parcubacteria bacterium]|nr:hypothetical protein [Candidatus Parcubacteria bacterium]